MTTRNYAILGYGERGEHLAETLQSASHVVTVFDPDDEATARAQEANHEIASRISLAVNVADAVFIAGPERTEFLRKLIQRAQAEAASSTPIYVLSRAFDQEAIRGCATRPEFVFAVVPDELVLDTLPRTTPA